MGIDKPDVTIEQISQSVIDDDPIYDEYLEQLRRMRIPRFFNGFYTREAVSKINELLKTVECISLIGYRKSFTNTYRWLFLDKQGENIASKIYSMIVWDISVYIKRKYGDHIRLGVFGSVAKGTATFPISRKLPTDQRRYFINWSDLDLYIHSTKVVDEETLDEIQEVIGRRVLSLSLKLPDYITIQHCIPHIAKVTRDFEFYSPSEEF